jgi:hypothetical protein
MVNPYLLAIRNRLAVLVCNLRCKGSDLLCYCLVDLICYGGSLCYKELVNICMIRPFKWVECSGCVFSALW